VLIAGLEEQLRAHVTARDVTCRNPACRQPAWRADLDHTLAYDDGGRTCDCNLGGLCPHYQLASAHAAGHRVDCAGPLGEKIRQPPRGSP